MCGIAGRFHPQALPPDAEWRARADERLAHRGPDGRGAFADERCELVHRRLALLDLSSTGRQPMPNETGEILVVFNGEIYNHRELRRDLEARGHRFRGSSDTEALVHLYEEFGERMVSQLRGMFAFAIYDGPRRTLLLARDRFGIKPLYIAELPDQLAFASEIKALLALANFAPTIHRQACYDYLGLNYVPEPETAFREIRALPPGCAMRVDANGSRQWRYARVTPAPASDASFPAAVDGLAESLQAAVRAQSVADVPVAALLSGGIDSSLVVAAWCQTATDAPHTFNVGFPDEAYDETPYARAVAERYRTQHTTLSLEGEALTPDLVRRLLLHFDQPFADSSLLPTYFVSRAIRERGIVCTLSGDGGDEAFGGYACFWQTSQFARLMQLPNVVQMMGGKTGEALTGYTQDFGRQMAKAFQLARAGRDAPARLLAGLLNYQTETQKRELVQAEARQALQSVYRWFDAEGAPRKADLEALSARLTEKLFTVSLTGAMLRKVDMMSMLAGIEVRVPMLDEAVVEGGLRLPHRYKTDGRTGKLVPRALAARWLPARVASHRKRGFEIPLDRMATPAFHEMLADLLLASTARTRDVLNRPLVDRWVRRFADAGDAPRAGELSREGLYQRIIILLGLELWLREHRLTW